MNTVTFEKMTDSELIAWVEDNTSYTGQEAELVVAAVRLFGVEPTEVEVDGNNVTAGGCEYLAGTDEEMEEAWEEDLENYIDDYVLHELPQQYRMYFDSEKFKADCRIDGRAHSLASYDGREDSITVEGTEYYFYRQN